MHGATSALLKGKITETGGQIPAITVYYGTSDAGTDAASWDHAVQVDAAIDFSVFVDGLQENTQYFYRSFATHDSGSAWSPATFDFQTLTSRPPQITNVAAREVGGTSANLEARIDDTGNDAPVVTLFYGKNDGGTNPAGWQRAIDLGVQSESFSFRVTNLEPNTDYFFTTRAVNANGTAWSATSVDFYEPEGRVPVFSAEMVFKVCR